MNFNKRQEINWIIPEDPNKFVDAAGLEEAVIKVDKSVK